MTSRVRNTTKYHILQKIVCTFRVWKAILDCTVQKTFLDFKNILANESDSLKVILGAVRGILKKTIIVWGIRFLMMMIMPLTLFQTSSWSQVESFNTVPNQFLVTGRIL